MVEWDGYKVSAEAIIAMHHRPIPSFSISSDSSSSDSSSTPSTIL